MGPTTSPHFLNFNSCCLSPEAIIKPELPQLASPFTLEPSTSPPSAASPSPGRAGQPAPPLRPLRPATARRPAARCFPSPQPLCILLPLPPCSPHPPAPPFHSGTPSSPATDGDSRRRRLPARLLPHHLVARPIRLPDPRFWPPVCAVRANPRFCS